jgi:hypothetical protein
MIPLHKIEYLGCFAKILTAGFGGILAKAGKVSIEAGLSPHHRWIACCEFFQISTLI